MAGHYPEILISGQRLGARKASVFARLEGRGPQAEDAADHQQSGFTSTPAERVHVHGSGVRILNWPGVLPCAETATVPLTRTLIDLARFRQAAR